MKHHVIVIALLSLSFAGVKAQEQEMDYRRSSIYSILVNHNEQQFASEIKEAFLQIPVSDKYNDHNLSVKVLTMDTKLVGVAKDEENPFISLFLINNQVASRLGRDGLTEIVLLENVIRN
ncbi:MAG: hypothetical protein MR387_01815 [Phocaeicola plebeius]|nr:hypothetical protein [Phocaeicola plebeius]